MQEPQDILTDIEQEVLSEPASTGSRFINYILDMIGFYIIVFLLVLADTSAVLEDGGFGSYFLLMFIFVGYYTLFEGVAGGKTPGKFMTGTRAVKSDGSPLSFTDALLRSLCRMVPFEPLSALGGRPWHDSWTSSKVIKD